MECSPGDVPMTLRLELKSGRGVQHYVRSGIFLGVACCVGFSAWPLWSIALEHSVHRQALTFKSPPVGLLPAHFTAFGVHSTTRRGGAQPHTAQSGPESKAWLQLSGQPSTSFPTWRAASPIPTYHRHDTGGLLLRARQPHRFSESLAFPQQRLPGQVFDAT